MLTDLLQTTSVQRLQGILRNRYGKGLKVSFMTDAQSVDMTSHSPSVSEGELRIPIFIRDRFFAYAYMEHITETEEFEQENIAQLVRLVLEPIFENWFSQQEEKNLMSTETTHFENIVPLNPSNFGFSAPEEIKPQFKSVRANLFFLKGSQEPLISKVAMQIHEITQRWALLPYQDIQNRIKTSHDIKSLGSVSIFIPDLSQISLIDQKIISESLKLAEDSDPLFLIGSTAKLADLQKDENLDATLAKMLSSSVIEVDRLPLDFKSLSETLEMILDSAQE